MKTGAYFYGMIVVYLVVIIAVCLSGITIDRAVTAISELPDAGKQYVVIDAGHGGEDGGASSVDGTPESAINLAIARKLNDVLHLMGIDTVMIRSSDISLSKDGNTYSSRKASDLRERLQIVNSTKNAIFVSIHQNYFGNSKYSGAQVFYAKTEGSRKFAETMQNAFKTVIDTQNNRMIQKADGIYLMENISCCGVLIECGFLSNPRESALLADEKYQHSIASMIGCICTQTVYDNRMCA